MKRRVIYFDFDRTLLDTDALKKEQATRIAAITQLTLQQVEEGMKAYVRNVNHLEFTPEGYAAYMADIYAVNPGDILKIYVTTPSFIRQFIFPEVRETLNELVQSGWNIGIFSAAIPGYQRLRIEATGILDYVHSELIIIDPHKTGIEALEKLPDDVLVVDDDRTVIEKLMLHMPRFRPVWCNRKTSEKLDKIPTITNLREVLPLCSSILT